MERVATPHGDCVLVELAEDGVDAALAALHPDERAHADALSPVRRRDFVAGRTALHAALDARGDRGARTPLLADDRGAPRLPVGLTGSISHKGRFAAAIAGDARAGFLGVDIEHAAPPRTDIALRILTAREVGSLPAVGGDPVARGRAVTLRFAIKEAIYKAVDPIVRRYVGFREVELELGAGDTPGPARCRAAHALPARLDATWCEHRGLWLATARAVRP